MALSDLLQIFVPLLLVSFLENHRLQDPDNHVLKKLRSWEHPETIELNKLLTQFEKDRKYPEHYNLDWGSINYDEFMKDGE